MLLKISTFFFALVVTAAAASMPSSSVLISFGGLDSQQNCLQDVTIRNFSSGAVGSGTQDYSGALMPTPLQGFGSALYDNKIYVLGGMLCDNHATLVNNFTAYDIASDTWTQLAPFHIPAVDVTLVAPGDGNVYALGGYTDHRWTFAYSVAQQIWLNVSSQPVPSGMGQSYDGCAVALNGSLYYMTNLGGKATFVSADGAQTWTQLASMNVERTEAACVALPNENKILIAGGNNDNTGYLSSVEVYDVVTNTWQLLSFNLFRARSGLRGVLLSSAGDSTGSKDTVALFCGGKDDAVFSDVCEAFNWTQQNSTEDVVASLSSPRAFFGLVYAT